MGMKIIKCRLCGKEFESRTAHRKYCDACVRTAKWQTSNRFYKKIKSAKAAHKPIPKKVRADVSQCRKCVYRGMIGSNVICDYLDIVGHMRGCEPSPNCSAFEKYSRARRSELVKNRHTTEKIAPAAANETAAYLGERIRAEQRYKQAHKRR